MKIMTKWRAVLTAAAVIANCAISPVIIAHIGRLRWLAYPVYFSAYVLLATVVLTVIVPPRRRQANIAPFFQNFLEVGNSRAAVSVQTGPWPWLRRRLFAWALTATLFLQRFWKVDDSQFQTGLWPRVRRMGPFAWVLTVALSAGPFFAALIIRFLGLEEKKAWTYVLASTLIATAFWVSIYLGVLGLLRAFVTGL